MIKSDALRDLVERSGVKTSDIIAFGHIPFDEKQLIEFIMLVIECQRKLDRQRETDREDRRIIQSELGYSRVGLGNT